MYITKTHDTGVTWNYLSRWKDMYSNTVQLHPKLKSWNEKIKTITTKINLFKLLKCKTVARTTSLIIKLKGEKQQGIFQCNFILRFEWKVLRLEVKYMMYITTSSIQGRVNCNGDPSYGYWHQQFSFFLSFWLDGGDINEHLFLIIWTCARFGENCGFKNMW